MQGIGVKPGDDGAQDGALEAGLRLGAEYLGDCFRLKV